MSKDSETENESFLADKIEPKKMDVLVEDFTENDLNTPPKNIDKAKKNDVQVFEPVFEVFFIFTIFLRIWAYIIN